MSGQNETAVRRLKAVLQNLKIVSQADVYESAVRFHVEEEVMFMYALSNVASMQFGS